MASKYRMYLSLSSALALFMQVSSAANAAEARPEGVDEIQVIGITPGGSLGQEERKIPFAVQNANYDDLEVSQSLDLSDFLNSAISSVNINSAQNNPLQPDVQFRGFTASPLLGLPQGIAVYQNGVRINEPLGDSVNWDLLPESAIYTLDVISGANPIFGLNTLGGALSLKMKNGFNFSGSQVEAYTGSWNRVVGNAESGGNFNLNDGKQWGYYLNISHFGEDGWRALSESEATNFYGSLSWRDEDVSTVDVIYQQGISDLTGNGALPVGMINTLRDSVFTAPDITENDMQMVNIDASHFISDSIQFSGNVSWRENTTDSFNGDGSEFLACTFAGGAESLFEEAEDAEDALDDILGIDLEDICEGGDPAITSFDALEAFIEQEALLAGEDPEDFELENIFDELSGTGIITDEAINNISHRTQTSRGVNGQLAMQGDLFSFEHSLILGFGYFQGESKFSSVLELANLDPVTRNTQGLGTGTFFDEAETDIATETQTLSWYFTDTIDLSEQLSLTIAGRYNDTDITLRDRSGERPELDGDHHFARFNPSLGITYNINDDTNVYASYSESNRVPTPIELSCNEGVFEVARQFAIAAGEDPDDIEFECRLPNAFLADPPLDDVVTKSVELGLRGDFHQVTYQVGLFASNNTDDIIFQSTGRSTGLFANVDETERWGFESGFSGSLNKLDWRISYSYISATFGNAFNVLSPNHPNADENGEVNVQKGDSIPGLPESIFKAGGDYYIYEDLRVGAEVIYNSAQYIRGDESNDLDQVNAHAVVNLRANYTFGDGFSVFARITNVFDNEYENFGLLGEDPSEIVPGLTDNRPIFLGVGAPRAGWLGMRYRF